MAGTTSTTTTSTSTTTTSTSTTTTTTLAPTTTTTTTLAPTTTTTTTVVPTTTTTSTSTTTTSTSTTSTSTTTTTTTTTMGSTTTTTTTINTNWVTVLIGVDSGNVDGSSIQQIVFVPVNNRAAYIEVLDTPLLGTDDPILIYVPQNNYDIVLTLRATAPCGLTLLNKSFVKLADEQVIADGVYCASNINVNVKDELVINFARVSTGINTVYADSTLDDTSIISTDFLLPDNSRVKKLQNVNANFFSDISLTTAANFSGVVYYEVIFVDVINSTTWNVLKKKNIVTPTSTFQIENLVEYWEYDYSSGSAVLTANIQIIYKLYPGFGYILNSPSPDTQNPVDSISHIPSPIPTTTTTTTRPS